MPLGTNFADYVLATSLNDDSRSRAMFNDTTLLVVDDEESICRGCQRILTPEGFRVETTNDAGKGLSLAANNDYAAILLDIRMPQMDGIEFLERLRKTKQNLPVIIITGYPSVASAASAMQLGAVDYVTKPFTPRAIARAVRRVVKPREIEPDRAAELAPPRIRSQIPAPTEFRFWDESWYQPLKGGVLRVGAMLPRAQGGTVEAVWPPRIGWKVYQGLPLAGATIKGSLHFTVPSPVTGEVVASNDLLLESPALLWDDPCGDGWIACVRPTRFEDEARNCKLRRVVLANADQALAREQSAQLQSLGCHVTIAEHLGEVGPALQQNPDCNVLMMHADSFGEHGPELVARIKVATPSMKIVVLASHGCKWESTYREEKIFYYAVDPFADAEIVDVVDAAFRPQLPRRPPNKPRRAPSTSMGRVCLTKGNGEKVALVAEKGLLQRDLGLGLHIIDRLADQGHPVETAPDRRDISNAIEEAVCSCPQVLILLARDLGRLPGSLVREASVPAPHGGIGTVTTLIAQRASYAGDPLDFDLRTTASLAEHIVHELTKDPESPYG
jgi:DNA-binding response OmpR family regulator/glycine cleavage system H lipoate-binding protein